MRGTMLAGVLALGIVGGGGGWMAWRAYQAQAVPLESIPSAAVERGEFAVTLASIGELRAAKSSVLSTPFEGKITKIIPEGTRVEPDDPVIWFETDDIENQLESEIAQLDLDKKDLQAAMDDYELEKIKNEYSLQSERTRVEISRQSYEDARQKFEAEKVLFEKNVSPQSKLDERRLALLQAELSLRNAQINLAKVEENLAGNLRVKKSSIDKVQLRVDRAEREVEEKQGDLEAAVVRATSPGDISYLKIWKSGSVAKVAEGDQVWRRSNLVEIPDTSEMHAVIPVNEIDISKIEIGQRAEVQLVALPGQVFPASVIGKSIVPISDPAQRSWDRGGGDSPGPREFEVRIRVEGTHDLFRQGMTAKAAIYLDERIDVLKVPLEALAEKDGVQGVWIEGTGGPDFQPVSVLAINQHHAAVDGPLTEGQRVFLRPPTDTSRPALLAAEAAKEAPADAPDAPAAAGGTS